MRFGTMLTRLALMVVLVTSCIGCGEPGGPKSGRVFFADGSPVAAGSIEFRGTTDEARFASRISPDGTFQPTDDDGNVGLPAGTYDVVIVQIVLTEDLALADHTHGNTVPRRYADYFTSGLQVDVNEGDVDPIEITVDVE